MTDLDTYAAEAGARSRMERLSVLCRTPALWALLTHRWGRQMVHSTGPSQHWKRACYSILHHVVSRVTKISLPVGAEVGDGVWLGPAGPIIVAPGTRLGSGVKLWGGNTIGIGGRPGARGVPVIEDDAVLAPGAIVVGPVTLGSGSIVAPNSVVTRTQSSAAWLWGAPAKPVPRPEETFHA